MIDVAKIKVKAGNGGDGRVSFRREKYIPKGGPDGGDGGNGGSIYFVADNNLSTLMDFRSKRIFEVHSGEEGGKKKMTGKTSEDLYIKVPVGTLVYEKRDEKEILVGDLTENGEKLLIARSGMGGKGNFRFRSSTNQTPMQYTKGTLGEEKEVRLEVKLIADIGLIGMPNAGKSTLINFLTNANAKVASYPFTTLSPNLGTCVLKNGQMVVLADIPGLIEGASKGKGLGDDFLRHIERTRILIHILDPMQGKAVSNYDTIRKELAEYGHGLSDKKEIVVVNKMDLTESRESFSKIKKDFKSKKIEVLGISAATGEGVDVLMNRVTEVLEKVPRDVSFEPEKVTKLYTIDNLPNKRMVFDKGKVITLDRKM